MTPTDTLSFSEVEASGLGDWRQLFYALHTRFLTGDFGTGVALVNAIGALAEGRTTIPTSTCATPTSTSR